MIEITDEELRRLEKKLAPSRSIEGTTAIKLVARLRRTEEERDEALSHSCNESRGLAYIAERALDRARLTPKEREVARLLLKGLSTREMADVTGKSEKGLKHQIASVFHKFNVASRAELFHCIFPT